MSQAYISRSYPLSAGLPLQTPAKFISVSKPERPKTESVMVGDGDHVREYMSGIKAALIKGEVPQIIIEGGRLIGEGESPESDKIIDYIRAILRRLSLANSGKELPPLKLFLSDQSGVNAGVITKAKDPIFIVDLGLLDFIVEHGFGEDHLAGIQGHERLHLLRHEKWENLRNGRPEETIGDVYGVLESHRAGYAPRALADLFNRLAEREENEIKKEFSERCDEKRGEEGRVLAHLLDVHPAINTRIRNVDVALAALQLKNKLNETITPIPEEIGNMLNEVRYKGHLEAYLSENKYDQSSVAEKVDLLGKYIENALILKDAFLSKLRLLKTIPRFKELRQNPEAAPYAEKWFEYFLQYKPEGFTWRWDMKPPYLWVVEQFLRLNIGDKEITIPEYAKGNEEKYKKEYKSEFEKLEKYLVLERDRQTQRLVQEADIPEKYKRLKIYSEMFLQANTREEALVAARQLERARKELGKFRNGLDLLQLEETEAKHPSRFGIKHGIKHGEPVQLSWEKHARWGLGEGEGRGRKDGRTSSGLIKQVLYSLRVYDPRLRKRHEYWSKNKFEESVRGKWKDLTFDEQGFIVDIKLTQDELNEIHQKRFEKKTVGELVESEYALQEARDKAEDELVKTVDWSGLEKDFWGFVDRYSKQLQPSITVVPGRHVFAKVFVKNLAKLVRKDSEKWEPIQRCFFTGYWPEYDDPRRSDERKYYPNSLPDLIAKFKKLYFGYEDRENTRYMETERGTLPHDHPARKLLTSYPESFWDHVKGRQKENFKYVNGKRILYYTRIKPTQKEKHRIRAPLRIDSNHPFVGPLLGLDKNSVDLSHKQKLISKFHHNDRNTRAFESYFRISPRAILGYKKPLNERQFKRFMKKLGGWGNRLYSAWDIVPFELLLTLRHLDTDPKAERFSFSKLRMLSVISNFSFLEDTVLAEKCMKELAALVNRQVERNRQIDFDPHRDLNTLVRDFCADAKADGENSVYDTDHHYRVFGSRPNLRCAYEDLIRNRIEALPVSQRLDLLNCLTKLEFMRPEYRKWVVDSWVEAAAQKLGIDDGSQEYGKKAGKIFEQALHESAQSIVCVLHLLERIEAQKDFALKTKEKMIEYYGQRFLEKDASARVADALIETCANDYELRPAFLKFITEPETEEGNALFLELIKQNAPGSDFVKKHIADPEKQIFPPLNEQITMMGYAHQNFWALPFELRTVYLDRILFPVRQKDNAAFNEAVAYVLDKVLPRNRKYAAESREALLVYLDCCPPELRRVTFSALLSAAIQKECDTPLRPGQVLSYVLTRTGAAGGQVLQAAHSYLSGLDLIDPDLRQLREDLKSSKVDFDRPLRWEIFERMAEVLPASATADIRHVGPILGCGSTAYVVACEKAHETTALKMMRKDVLPIADLHFERYRATCEVLAKKHAGCEALPSIIDRAVETIKISTDGEISKKQVIYAEGLYNALSVSVCGKTFKPKVAAFKSAGKEFLETELAEGRHLNDMKCANPQDYAYRRSAAIAIDAMEELLTTSGVAIDEDCHNGQQKIEGMIIGRFDVGAIPYDLSRNDIAIPTEAQKRALGKLYGIVLNAALNGDSPVEAMTAALTRNDWGAEKPYLIGVMRARLARMDFFAAFGAATQERQAVQAGIIKAVWETGRVDPVLLDGMMETLSVKSTFKLAQAALNARTEGTPDIRIIGASPLSEEQTPSLPRLALSFTKHKAAALLNRHIP